MTLSVEKYFIQGLAQYTTPTKQILDSYVYRISSG
jgi:hypothetical protein